MHFKILVISISIIFLLIKSITATENEKSDIGFLYKCSEKVGNLKIPGFFSSILQLDVPRSPTCQNGHFVKEIQILHDKRTKNSYFPFTHHGYLVLIEDDEQVYYSRNSFCVAKITPARVLVHLCKSQCYSNYPQNTGSNICLNKCCKYGEVLTADGCETSFKVFDWGHPLLPNISSHLSSPPDQTRFKIYPQFRFNEFNRHWNCSLDNPIQMVIPANRIRILEDGRIFKKPIKKFQKWKVLYNAKEKTHRKFCLDAFLDFESLHDPTTMELNVTEYKVFFCQNLDSNSRLYPYIIFGITLTTTLIHLMTVVVHLILWDHHNVHGWTAFVVCATQLFLNLFLCILFGTFGFDDPEDVLLGNLHFLCLAIGISHHFLLISSFSWSTVFAFDAWSKIRSMTPTSTSSKGKKRFMVYCIPGFGTPFVVVTIAIIVEFSENSLVKPEYNKSCIIDNGLGYLLFIILIIGTFFLANCFFAFHTLRLLRNTRKETKILTITSQSSSRFDTRASLVLKLFILMGILLGFEITLSFFSPGNANASIYLVILDFYRIPHAFGLFWIFILNTKTTHQLQHKFPKLSLFLTRITFLCCQSPHDVSTISEKTLGKTVAN